MPNRFAVVKFRFFVPRFPPFSYHCTMETIRKQYDAVIRRLSAVYPGSEARAMAGIVFDHFAGVRRHEILLDQDRPPVETTRIGNAVEELLLHKPVQYVTGRAWFCGLEFEVNEHTLIPRPETEELVRWIAGLPHRDRPAVLDIGTGSGCIAVALATLLPGASVTGADISPEALRTARRNAEKNGAKVSFLPLDILFEELPARYDLIVSNPPYVLESEKTAIRDNVLKYEPHTALFVPDRDPLLFYRVIAEKAPDRLHAGGKLFFEINERCGEGVARILERSGYSGIEVRKDLFEKDRMIKAEMP